MQPGRSDIELGPGSVHPLPLPGTIDTWIDVLWNQHGTDLILSAGTTPRIRVDGQLVPLDTAVLSGAEIRELARRELPASVLQRLDIDQDADFSFSWREKARIRGNAFMQRGETSLALRIVPYEIPTLEELGVPDAVADLAALDRGLVLVTGPTGSGKSTTLAALVHQINHTRSAHVLTIEDPIEYVHQHERSLISQREIGVDAPSFARALRAAFREDPDVLLLGEMRDLESIQTALTMAETGHLVLATLHTNDSVQAVDRIIDVFPSDRQEQIRVQLAATLAAVVAQRLVPKTGGGLVAAFEVLLASQAVRNLIREGKSNQLRNVITMSLREGMQTLEVSLARLLDAGQVDEDSARAISLFPKELAGPSAMRLAATAPPSR